jgi:hypothetical protein
VRVRIQPSAISPGATNSPGDTKKRAGWLGSSMAFSRIIPHSDGAGVIDAGSKSPVADRDEAITVINELAADAPRDQLAIRQGRLLLTHDFAADSAAAALAGIAIEAIHLFTGPDAETLQACGPPDASGTSPSRIPAGSGVRRRAATG